MNVGERYVLGRLIGEGATACVYEAEDTVLQREVAVKVFRDKDIGDSTSERITEETRILASLAHPNLLPVYDSGRSADGHRFIVMPVVRGTTLAKSVAHGPVEPREVKRIGKALADALSHIHARGVVHRDVKPSNVLLADDGTPYLADFGFAHAVDGPALTATGCVVGTAGYLAPEQAEGLSVTPAADVYALGLVLLEALTGERAYRGTPLERATANALRPPRIPARLGPDWLRVLRTMTARTPSGRPAAGEVGALVDGGEDELPTVTASDGTMELPVAGPWTGPDSGVSEPSLTAVSSTEADAGRPHSRRLLAALGAAAFVTAAGVGMGAGWLLAGASAATHSPGPMIPGAGAAGPRQIPAPAAKADPGSAAVPATTVYTPVSRHVPAPSPSAKCQTGDGKNGNGHSKHKCEGGGENGDG